MKSFLQILFFFLVITKICFAQWVQTGRPTEVNVHCLALYGSEILAGTESGVYSLGVPDGNSFNNGLVNGLVFTHINCLAIQDTNVFAGTEGGIFASYHRADINGICWNMVNTGLTSYCVMAMTFKGDSLFAGTSGGGVFLSSDYGTNWIPVSSGLDNMFISSFAVVGNDLFAGTGGGGIYRSTNNGTNWINADSGLGNLYINALVVEGTSLFAGTQGGIFLSENEGSNWTSVDSGLTDQDVISFAVSGTNIYGGTSQSGVFLSTNHGGSWNSVNSGLTNLCVGALQASGQNIYAGTIGGGLFRTSDNGTNWVKPANMTPIVKTLTTGGSTLFAGTFQGGAFVSNDNGNSWVPVNTGLTYGHEYVEDVYSILISDSNIIASTSGGIYLSTNFGDNWALANRDINLAALIPDGGNIIAGCNVLYQSTDDGANWSPIINWTNGMIKVFALSGSNLFAGTFGSGILLSTNNGSIWNPVNNGLPDSNIQSMAVSGTNIYAAVGDNNGIYLSTNNGSSWSSANNGLSSLNVSTFAVSDSNIFAGTIGLGGVFLSTNNGKKWTLVTPESEVNIQTVVVNDTYLFVGLASPEEMSKKSNKSVYGDSLFSSGIWRRPLSEIITTVKQGTVHQYLEYSLQQNYPNPFNPSTTISYNLPKASHVLIKVYDILGREVTTLVNEEKNAGSYSFEFNAGMFASGIYFYRIQAGSFVETKKLILLK
jgi:photosystem II stability/assembly factor-like uncharacterized protein